MSDINTRQLLDMIFYSNYANEFNKYNLLFEKEINSFFEDVNEKYDLFFFTKTKLFSYNSKHNNLINYCSNIITANSNFTENIDFSNIDNVLKLLNKKDEDLLKLFYLNKEEKETLRSLFVESILFFNQRRLYVIQQNQVLQILNENVHAKYKTFKKELNGKSLTGNADNSYRNLINHFDIQDSEWVDLKPISS